MYTNYDVVIEDYKLFKLTYKFISVNLKLASKTL